MAYDEAVAERLREQYATVSHVTEKKMFGGIAFMHHGNMCCGVVGEELMVSVGAEAYEEALGQPHARAMDFTGRPLRGMVYVGTPGFESDEDLDAWVARGTAFTRSLPRKSSRA